MGGLGISASLIVDSDKDFLRSLTPNFAQLKQAPVYASNYRDASRILCDRAIPLSAVLMNPLYLDPGGIELIKDIHLNRPSLPVFVYSEQPVFAREELVRMAVNGAISTRELVPKVQLIAERSDKLFQAEKMLTDEAINPTTPEGVALEVHQAHASFVDQVIAPDGNKYVAIPARDFLSCERSFFDVYIRLGSGKLIKVLEANDRFTPDRIQTYLKKGLNYFFLNSGAQKSCLEYCDLLAERILSRPGVSFEMKLSSVLSEGSQILRHIKSDELNEDSAETLGEFIGNVHLLLKQSDPHVDTLKKTLMSRGALYDHAMGILLVAGLLTRPLKIESDVAFRTVGLAALLHDIGLYELPDTLLKKFHVVEDDRGLNDDERVAFQQHPILGVEKLRSLNFSEAVVRGVLEHHEIRTGKGYPRGLRGGQISQAGELIGISDQFVRLIHQKKLRPTIDPLYTMQTEVFQQYSYPVVEAFESVFLK